MIRYIKEKTDVVKIFHCFRWISMFIYSIWVIKQWQRFIDVRCFLFKNLEINFSFSFGVNTKARLHTRIGRFISFRELLCHSCFCYIGINVLNYSIIITLESVIIYKKNFNNTLK